MLQLLPLDVLLAVIALVMRASLRDALNLLATSKELRGRLHDERREDQVVVQFPSIIPIARSALQVLGMAGSHAAPVTLRRISRSLRASFGPGVLELNLTGARFLKSQDLIDADITKHFPHLRRLSLYDCAYLDSIIGIVGCAELQELDASNTGVGSFTLRPWGVGAYTSSHKHALNITTLLRSSPSLRVLRLSNCGLDNDFLSTLVASAGTSSLLAQLEVLDVCLNPLITSAGISALKGCSWASTPIGSSPSHPLLEREVAGTASAKTGRPLVCCEMSMEQRARDFRVPGVLHIAHTAGQHLLCLRCWTPSDLCRMVKVLMDQVRVLVATKLASAPRFGAQKDDPLPCWRDSSSVGDIHDSVLDLADSIESWSTDSFMNLFGLLWVDGLPSSHVDCSSFESTLETGTDCTCPQRSRAQMFVSSREPFESPPESDCQSGVDRARIELVQASRSMLAGKGIPDEDDIPQRDSTVLLHAACVASWRLRLFLENWVAEVEGDRRVSLDIIQSILQKERVSWLLWCCRAVSGSDVKVDRLIPQCNRWFELLLTRSSTPAIHARLETWEAAKSHFQNLLLIIFDFLKAPMSLPWHVFSD